MITSKPQSSFALLVLKAQQILCSTWIINGDKLEEEAPLSYQSQASSSWLTLQRKAAPSEAMSEQVLGEEPYWENGLCQYAQKMTACFGRLGKEIKDMHVDFLSLLMWMKCFLKFTVNSWVQLSLQPWVSKLCVSSEKAVHAE